MADDVVEPAPESAVLDDLLTADARERILSVRQALRELSALLARQPGGNGEFELAAPARKASAARAAPKARKRR